MTEIRLFNTLTGGKEAFRPIEPGRVGLYDCGPTVYDDAHIGNLRSYVFADVLRRTLEYNGYGVKQVINITDVGHLTSDADDGDDKMTKALRRLGKPLTLEAMKEAAAGYESSFKRDLAALNIEAPAVFPRASEHIQEEIELIRALEEKGFAYGTGDGMYFDTSKFKDYGKLGRRRPETAGSGDQAGKARVINAEKRRPADFALWKFDGKLGWDSPWGKGFPGWHLECSAMSRKYLGQPFDIHTGGIDHIPVHHNNEIAQSEAAYGKPLANLWMHNAFLTAGKARMAKSAGGFITLKALAEGGVSPLAYRYWLLTGHYRSPMEFSFEAVRAAGNARDRLAAAAAGWPGGGKPDTAYGDKFRAAANDDLDTPAAAALAWELTRDKNISDTNKRATLLDFDRVLGLRLSETSPAATAKTVSPENMPSGIRDMVAAREEAREAGNWAEADALRLELEKRGYAVKDTAAGTLVERA